MQSFLFFLPLLRTEAWEPGIPVLTMTSEACTTWGWYNWGTKMLAEFQCLFKIKNYNLPLCPRQLVPKHVPCMAQIRQDKFSLIALGRLGETANPPGFCLEKTVILAPNFIEVSTLRSSAKDFRKSKYRKGFTITQKLYTKSKLTLLVTSPWCWLMSLMSSMRNLSYIMMLVATPRTVSLLPPN